MSKAALHLGAVAPVSKLDATDWTREAWRLAYRQSRAMIRDRRTTTAATAYV